MEMGGFIKHRNAGVSKTEVAVMWMSLRRHKPGVGCAERQELFNRKDMQESHGQGGSRLLT